MPPFRKVTECPTCEGSGKICIIDRPAMAAARRAKNITVTAMSKRLKTTPTAILRIETGGCSVTDDIEKAYAELLPKKARGGP